MTDYVSDHGAVDWESIGRLLGGRTGLQCRIRWTETLNPDIKRGAWTTEEVSCALVILGCARDGSVSNI